MVHYSLPECMATSFAGYLGMVHDIPMFFAREARVDDPGPGVCLAIRLSGISSTGESYVL